MTKRGWQECTLGVAVIGGVLFFAGKCWAAHTYANNPVADANIGAGLLGLSGIGLVVLGMFGCIVGSILKR